MKSIDRAGARFIADMGRAKWSPAVLLAEARKTAAKLDKKARRAASRKAAVAEAAWKKLPAFR
jgi:hypothetical protein